MILAGQVSHFDDHSGLGEIAADDGTRPRFHCIAIADGTRTIEAGQRVAFTSHIRFGHLEAADIVKL
jgi:cold shock CspA family protein